MSKGEIAELGTANALIVVDVQNDFCPGGSLPIQGGHDVVPVLNAWMNAAAAAGAPVFASRDWHPSEHLSFLSSGGMWPVHCVAESKGAAFHPALRLPAGTVTVTKGDRTDKDQYSAFDETGLASDLKRRGIRRVWVGGLAQDVCVRATALDAIRAGFETHLIPAASMPVTEAGGAAALAEMREAGVQGA